MTVRVDILEELLKLLKATADRPARSTIATRISTIVKPFFIVRTTRL